MHRCEAKPIRNENSMMIPFLFQTADAQKLCGRMPYNLPIWIWIFIPFGSGAVSWKLSPGGSTSSSESWKSAFSTWSAQPADLETANNYPCISFLVVYTFIAPTVERSFSEALFRSHVSLRERGFNRWPAGSGCGSFRRSRSHLEFKELKQRKIRKNKHVWLIHLPNNGLVKMLIWILKFLVLRYLCMSQIFGKSILDLFF